MLNRLMLAAALFLLVTPGLGADTLDVVKGTTGYNAFPTPVSTPFGVSGTFWNNWSIDDNHNCNIGFWLSGPGAGGCMATGGTFHNGSPSLTPDYLGDETTGFQVNKSANTHSVTVTTKMQVTAYKDVNEFGWFDANTPSVLNPLFTGVGMLNNSRSFVPSGDYGFYISSPEGIYKSTGEGDSRTHFAVFQLPGSSHYMVGVEDMWVGADWDYNDVIFEIQSTEAPEPASMLLLGTGLVGIGAAIRRRRQG